MCQWAAGAEDEATGDVGAKKPSPFCRKRCFFCDLDKSMVACLRF